MAQIHEGQCGLCRHFGEQHANAPQLIQIRSKHEAMEDLVDRCGHPKHAELNLIVTPISGCSDFMPAAHSVGADD